MPALGYLSSQKVLVFFIGSFFIKACGEVLRDVSESLPYAFFFPSFPSDFFLFLP